jgi:hypothetical protein
VVSVTDSYGRILGFLVRLQYNKNIKLRQKLFAAWISGFHGHDYGELQHHAVGSLIVCVEEMILDSGDEGTFSPKIR